MKGPGERGGSREAQSDCATFNGKGKGKEGAVQMKKEITI